MKKKRAPGAGGKLGRSEQVTVRFTPELRKKAEEAAKKDRRTLSNYIEVCVEKACKEVILK